MEVIILLRYILLLGLLESLTVVEGALDPVLIVVIIIIIIIIIILFALSSNRHSLALWTEMYREALYALAKVMLPNDCRSTRFTTYLSTFLP